MTPARSGYADVNGIKLYHEIYGSGEPQKLCHSRHVLHEMLRRVCIRVTSLSDFCYLRPVVFDSASICGVRCPHYPHVCSSGSALR